MQRQISSAALASRFKRLFSRLMHGSRTYTPKQIAQRIELPFSGFNAPQLTVSWENNLNFQHLYKLPRHALSGPVQEDKSQAHTILNHLIKKETDTQSIIDLRELYGFGELQLGSESLSSLERFASSGGCRSVRIISYRDFKKTIEQAIPDFFTEQPIQLLQASWLGPELFWAGQKCSCEFACAVVYARLRGLELPKAAHINRYMIDRNAVHNIARHYHMPIMPEQAWDDPEFMTALVETGSPYVRLTLSPTPHPIEVLLLPKHKQLSDTLGTALKLAGAYDASTTLLQLSST